jgi:hypothetical protein
LKKKIASGRPSRLRSAPSGLAAHGGTLWPQAGAVIAKFAGDLGFCIAVSLKPLSSVSTKRCFGSRCQKDGALVESRKLVALNMVAQPW